MVTTLTPDNNVGEFVVERPARSRVFDRLGIDYCCGGKKTLAEACRRRGLNPDQVIASLDEEAMAEVGIDPAKLTLTQLADHIERTHHAWLREELPRIHQMAEKVAGVHGGHYRWLIELFSVYQAFELELKNHMLKEEQILFPLIRQLEMGANPVTMLIMVDAPVHCMETEHENAGRAIERMRWLSDDFTPPEGACNTFRALLDALAGLESDLHQHVHKENNILFPRAIELGRRLTESESMQIK